MEPNFAFLAEYDRWYRFFHIAGAIVAVGSVVATDITLAFLKLKPKMAPLVARFAPFLSMQVWTGLLLLSASGLLMYLPMQGIERAPLFQLKMALVLLVFLNGIALNIWVTPMFEKLAPEWHLNSPQVKKFTFIAGVAAAISFIGWWGIILLMTVFY